MPSSLELYEVQKEGGHHTVLGEVEHWVTMVSEAKDLKISMCLLSLQVLPYWHLKLAVWKGI